MEATSHLDAILSYLTALRERATQEIEARKPVELESQDTPEVVPPLIDVTITISPIASGLAPDTPGEPPSHRIFTTLAEAFAHHSGRLVLLGRPGSGKTTTLWMFARERTEACLADPHQPLPIFLKIDTWNRKTPIADWVRSQMPDLPLQNVPLLYLCDGLDELGGERPVDLTKPVGERFDPRADFLSLAEAQFVESQFVISCRSAEYEQIRSKMHGCGAVTLLPLDEEKIEEFLASWDRPRLWEALRSDANLMELARTPLLLSLLTSAIGADGIDAERDLQHLSESTLFRFYFDRRFVHEERKFQAQSHGQALPFDKAVTQKLLGKLARYMWHWRYDPLTTLDRIEARFHLGAQADTFLDFACRMHFLRESPDGHIAFIHLKFRDFCVAPALQQALEDDTAEVRSDAADILGEIKEMGFPALLEALNHTNFQVRWAAGSKLPQEKSAELKSAIRQAVPSLLRTLYSDDPGIRSLAARLLIYLGPTAAPELLQALQANDVAIRCTVASAFAVSGRDIDPVLYNGLLLAVPALAEGLQQDDKALRSLAASSLAHLAHQTDPAPATGAVDSAPRSQPLLIVDSAEAPGKLEPHGPAPDPSPVREMLRQTIPVLVEALRYGGRNSEDYQIHNTQSAVESALLSLQDYFLPDLLPALRDNDLDVRSAALLLLMRSKKYNDPMAQEALTVSVSAAAHDIQSSEGVRRRAAIWDLARLVPLLQETDADFRETLQQAVPALLEALQEGEEVRWEAGTALVVLDAQVTPTLLQALAHKEAPVRRQAAVRLARLASHRGGLTRTVDNPTELSPIFVTKFQVALLQALPVLLKALDDSDAGVRKAVRSILKQQSEETCIWTQSPLPNVSSLLRQALRHRDIPVRRAAAFLLVHSGAGPGSLLQEALPEILPVLLQAARSKESQVRSSARHYLFHLQEKLDASGRETLLQAVPALLQALKSKENDFHNPAAFIHCLGPSAIPALRHALQGKNAKVRCLAVSTLSSIRLSTDPDYLSRHGFPDDPALREAFQQAMPDLINALQDRSAPVREEAIYLLSRVEEQAIPALRQALCDRDRRVQNAAREVYRYAPPALPVLLEALQDSRVVVRRNAAAILSECRLSAEIASEPPLSETSTPIAPILLQALRDRDATVREHIAYVLISAGKQVDPPLLEMLKENAFPLRAGAAYSLGYRRTAIPSLLRLLQGEHRAARWAALTALYRQGYIPRLALRPRPHITLHYTFTSKRSTICEVLLRLQMRATFLHGIPIHLAEPEEQSPEGQAASSS